MGGRDQDRTYTRTEAAVRDAGGIREVFVPEDSALERTTRWKWARWRGCWFRMRRGTRCERDWWATTLGKLSVPVAALFSHAGPHGGARHLDAALAMIWLKEFFGQLMERVKINEVSTFNGENWEPKTLAR